MREITIQVRANEAAVRHLDLLAQRYHQSRSEAVRRMLSYAAVNMTDEDWIPWQPTPNDTGTTSLDDL